jgi:hypothetical protein
MPTQTAENLLVTEENATAPVVLDGVTKRYGRRRGAVAAAAGPPARLVAAVIVLTAGAVMIPFWIMRRREPSLAPA